MELQKTIDNLVDKGYTVSYFETGKEAAAYLNQKVDRKTVGFGDSVTLSSMRLYESLATHNEVFDPMHFEPGTDFFSIAKRCLTTEVFFTSVNALAVTGEMVNIDQTGNRIAGSLFGHEKVYFLVGLNKIASTLEEAIWRARNVAAPKNAARQGVRTPCAIRQDRCYDCNSPERICCGQIIYHRKMDSIDMEIVLVKESFGY